MTFSSEVKEEICKAELHPKKTELYGLLLFSRSFKFNNVTFATENKNVFEKAKNLIISQYNIILDVVSNKNAKRNTFVFNVPLPEDRKKVLSSFLHCENEISLRIHDEKFSSKESVRDFLKGAFLSCGTVTDPKISYHLEFSVQYMNLAKDLAEIISSVKELGLNPGITNRKGAFIVYIKGSESITDFLTYIGATSSAMKMIQVKMVKEVRNYVNRTTNFETANLNKTVGAAAVQIEAIKKIRKFGLFESMGDDLKELAMLRLANPDMSLKALGESLSRPLTRSGANHKIKKLLEIAETAR